MIKEQLVKANALNDEILSWEARKKAISEDAERVSLAYNNKLFSGSIDLSSEELRIIREGLGNYYDSIIASLEEEFEKL